MAVSHYRAPGPVARLSPYKPPGSAHPERTLECAQLLLRGSRASALAEEIKRPAGEGGDEGLRGLAAGRGGADLGGGLSLSLWAR